MHRHYPRTSLCPHFTTKFNADTLQDNYQEKRPSLSGNFMLPRKEFCEILFDVLLGTYPGFHPCVGVIYLYEEKQA